MSLRLLSTHEPDVRRTTNAMLVCWALFAQRISLIDELAKVSILQRTGEHAPQSKLIESLVAILDGRAHLRDISRGVHPLDRDRAVADPWCQSAGVDYSDVSCTRRRRTAETLQTVRQEIGRVSWPFVDRAVMLALRGSGIVVLMTT